MPCSYAEYLAGTAFNSAGLGYVHAMSHQLGGFYNFPHGVCNAILLPAVEVSPNLLCGCHMISMPRGIRTRVHVVNKNLMPWRLKEKLGKVPGRQKRRACFEVHLSWGVWSGMKC